MIEIYTEKEEYLGSVETKQQFVGFMYNHEFELPVVIIKKNGKKKTVTFDEAMKYGTEGMFSKYSEYYLMEKICSLAEVDYEAYKQWKKTGKMSISMDEIYKMLRIMQDIGGLSFPEANEALKKEREYTLEK